MEEKLTRGKCYEWFSGILILQLELHSGLMSNNVIRCHIVGQWIGFCIILPSCGGFFWIFATETKRRCATKVKLRLHRLANGDVSTTGIGQYCDVPIGMCWFPGCQMDSVAVGSCYCIIDLFTKVDDSIDDVLWLI